MTLDLSAKRTDFILLFVARALRMFSYGMIAIVMIKNLELKYFSGEEIGLIQFAVILGDIIISLYLTTKADKIGRKKTLIIGAILKIITGIFYAYSYSLLVLIITGIIGVISVTGTQIGPFLPIEQSALSQIIEECTERSQDIPKNTSRIFGYYGMVGYISQACGGACTGFLYTYLMSGENGWSEVTVTNFFFYIYALFGLLKVIAYGMIDNSTSIEAKAPKQKVMLNFAGIDPKNMPTIVMLSVLFAFDAFGGAFVAKSFISYFFYEKYQIVLAQVGMLLFFCNIVSGISGILSSKLVQRIGAMATMIFTHLPSNLFLLVIPFVSNSYLAMVLLLGRFCISQMDVPARQTYVNFVVSSSQRSAANGITNIARSVGLSIGMGINGYFISIAPQNFMFSVPFLIAGGIKIIYDITLGCCFLWGQKKKDVDNHLELAQVDTSKNQSDNNIDDQIKSEDQK